MSEHWYTRRGKLVSQHTPKAMPSATTILDVINKPELNEWRLRIGAQAAHERMTVAAERGTSIHSLVSDWIDGRTVEAVNADHEGALHGYINWADKAQPTALESEVFLYSKAHGYAGTADIICRLDGELWVVDLKTSKVISPSYGLQLRAYEQALFEQRGEHARTAVLQLTDKNKAGYRFKELSAPLDVFLGAKAIFDWQLQFRKDPKFDGKTLYSD